MPAALRRRLAGRVERWARRRQGPDRLPLRLESRRLYILPTRTGLAAALLVFVMLLAGLNYSNSLALFLTFLLAGCMLVGMHECQRTLQGLEIVQAQAPDCHAGGTGLLELRFSNATAMPRRALTVRSGGAAPSHFDLEGQGTLSVRVAFDAPRRGRLRLGRLELATTAPFGLFRCWAWLYLPLEVIVYPQRAGARALPPPAAGPRRRQASESAAGDEEWAALRPYQVGDSPRSIAWKAWARGAPLMVAQYAGSAGSDYLLSFAGLDALDLEARLSQLAVWVEACAQRDAPCALRLPEASSPLGRGAAHRRRLLRQLALYGEARA